MGIVHERVRGVLHVSFVRRGRGGARRGESGGRRGFARRLGDAIRHRVEPVRHHAFVRGLFLDSLTTTRFSLRVFRLAIDVHDGTETGGFGLSRGGGVRFGSRYVAHAVGLRARRLDGGGGGASGGEGGRVGIEEEGAVGAVVVVAALVRVEEDEGEAVARATGEGDVHLAGCVERGAHRRARGPAVDDVRAGGHERLRGTLPRVAADGPVGVLGAKAPLELNLAGGVDAHDGDERVDRSLGGGVGAHGDADERAEGDAVEGDGEGLLREVQIGRDGPAQGGANDGRRRARRAPTSVAHPACADERSPLGEGSGRRGAHRGDGSVGGDTRRHRRRGNRRGNHGEAGDRRAAVGGHALGARCLTAEAQNGGGLNRLARVPGRYRNRREQADEDLSVAGHS